MLSLKNVIRELKFEIGPNSELVDRFELNWAMLASMHQIADEILKHISFYESNELIMCQHVKRLFMLLNWALTPASSDSDETLQKKGSSCGSYNGIYIW